MSVSLPRWLRRRILIGSDSGFVYIDWLAVS